MKRLNAWLLGHPIAGATTFGAAIGTALLALLHFSLSAALPSMVACLAASASMYVAITQQEPRDRSDC